MKIDTQLHIAKPPQDVYRILLDIGAWLQKVDSDVVNVKKQTDGPVGINTKWVETMKVPGNEISVDLLVTANDPGKSFVLAFDTEAMSGTGTFTVTPSGSGGDESDVTMDMRASVKFWRGWILYPMIRRDLPRRERKRLANFKRLVESGELGDSTV